MQQWHPDAQLPLRCGHAFTLRLGDPEEEEPASIRLFARVLLGGYYDLPALILLLHPRHDSVAYALLVERNAAPARLHWGVPAGALPFSLWRSVSTRGYVLDRLVSVVRGELLARLARPRHAPQFLSGLQRLLGVGRRRSLRVGGSRTLDLPHLRLVCQDAVGRLRAACVAEVCHDGLLQRLHDEYAALPAAARAAALEADHFRPVAEALERDLGHFSLWPSE